MIKIESFPESADMGVGYQVVSTNAFTCNFSMMVVGKQLKTRK